ncbi:MAG: relaxase/mobilization nuclease domain-containing protein [Acutalibacteraceae bacterium]|nr:relaxase/mobilization nuclease domain-containing protein [Acutalibacteraceae bacterium]
MENIVKFIRHSDAGMPYLWNMCFYGREREISRGGFGLNPYDPETAYSQMEAVKRYFNQTSTNPLIHIVVSFDGWTDNAEFAMKNAPAIAAFFKDHYQLIWMVHPADPDSSHFHMHILLHSVNLQNGKLFHSGPYEMNAFCYHVKSITGMGFRLVCEQRDNWTILSQ